MASSEDVTQINGRYITRAAAILKIDGRRYQEVVSVKYGAKRPKNPVRILDEAGTITGHTSGQVEYEDLSIVLRKEAAMLCKKYLAAKGNGSTGDAVVPITLTYSMPGKDPIQVVFEGATFLGNSSEVGDNTDPINDELTFAVRKITENGIFLEARITQ